eukprot:m.71908 g.71908  ORF g.71908 m.71908 type:complete len:64 (-) comp11719_c0_seq10:423-614(-)
MNAILNKNSSSLRGCVMYLMKFPDNESAKLIVQARIGEVVYISKEDSWNITTQHSCTLSILLT